ncbi:hypothetical protein V6N13_061394 [Hibiscus sabdariffa]
MPTNNLNAIPQRNQNNFYANHRKNQETLAEYKEKNDTTMQNLAASVQNLEIQIGQIADALNNIPHVTLLSDIEDPRQTRNEQCKTMTLRSGRQCEPEPSAKQVVQTRGEELIEESPAEPEKYEVESSNTVKMDIANEHVDAKQQPDANRTLGAMLEYLTDDSDDCQLDDKLKSILRMDLAQLYQEINVANNISIDDQLEETTKDEQQSEPLETCDKRLKDDKGDVSAETTGPALAVISVDLQNSAERLAALLAYP